MSKRGWWLFLAMGAIWGIPYLLIRVAVRQVDPSVLVLARTAPASLLLAPLVARRGQFGLLWRNLKWIAIFGIVEFGIPWYFMSTAEKHITSSLTSLMVCAIPLLALVVTRFSSKREAIGRRRALGVALGAIGVVLLVGLDLHGGSLKWIALMLGVCVGYTIGPMILARPLAHVPGPVVVCGATGVVALGWLPYSLAHWPHHVDWRTGASLATLSVVCTATAFLVFFELIKESGPSKSLVVVYVNTALAVVLGIALLHEPLTKGIVLGFPLIVVGSYFATSSATIADVAAEAGAHPDIVTDH